MNYFEKKLIEFYELRRGNEDLIKSNKRQQEMLEQLKISNHPELIEILNQDVQQLILDYNKSQTQLNRRGLIRAIFAFIEGNIFKIKEEIVIEETHKRKPALSTEELILLKEKTPYINDKGKVKSSPKYSELSANIRFAFDCYAKSAGINNDFDPNRTEWKCLIESISVRNRIMHPKNSTDLNISENEIVKAVISYIYFKKMVTNLSELKISNLKEIGPGQVRF